MRAMAELTNDRTRALVEAGIALASELSLDAVLQKLVDTAAELTGARYAALGVIDLAGHGLERFVTTGVDAETIERIGELPRGRGILGLLITRRAPAAPPRPARRPALGRLPAAPPGDDDLPRDAGRCCAASPTATST